MQKGTEVLIPRIEETFRDIHSAIVLLKSDESATFAVEWLISLAQQLERQGKEVLREECASFAGIQEEIRYVNSFLDEESKNIKKLKLNKRLEQFGLRYDWNKQCVVFTNNEEIERNKQNILNLLENQWLLLHELQAMTNLTLEETQNILDLLIQEGKLRKTLVVLPDKRKQPFYHKPDVEYQAL